MSKEPTKGIVLVAVNHAYYGNYAFQLALSLKHGNPHIKITLAHDDVGISHLSESKRKIFDNVLRLKDSVMMIGERKETMKFKAYLYDISPYDETLYLDADILWHPRRTVNDFLDTIPKKVKFTMQNRGKIDLTKPDAELNSNFNIWVNTKKLKETYKFKKGFLYNLSSELIYFKKDEKVAELFKQVKVEFSMLKVGFVDFSGGIPDELPFGIAMIKKNYYPHIENWRPIYWEAFDKKRLLLDAKNLYEQYFACSFGGNIQEKMIKKFYDNLAQYYCNQFGEQYRFPLKDKRSFIPQRHTI